MVQPRRNLPLSSLRAFESAARHLRVAKAAEELGVTHSAISHQIRTLEQQLGAALFDRSRKPFRLTAEGEQLLQQVSSAFDSLCDATTKVRMGKLEGHLTISCVPGLGANWFVPLLGQFLEAFPRLRVRVMTQHWRSPPATLETDLAIVYGKAEYPGRRVTYLGHSQFFPVCSPRLIRGAENVKRPADLCNFNLLHEYDEEGWSQWLAKAGVDQVGEVRGIYFDGAHWSLQAARAGYGIALADMPTVDTDLLDGRLIRLFDISIRAIYPYHLVTRPLNRMSVAMREMENWVVAGFQRFHYD